MPRVGRVPGALLQGDCDAAALFWGDEEGSATSASSPRSICIQRTRSVKVLFWVE